MGRSAHVVPTAPQRALHAGLERPRYRQGAHAAGRLHRARSRGFGRARGQDGGTRPGRGRAPGRRFRAARGDRADQRARHRLVARRRERGRPRPAGCAACSQSVEPGASGARRRPAPRPERVSCGPGPGPERAAAPRAARAPPLAALQALAIAAAAKDVETRLSAFVMGTNDLAKDTRTRITAGRDTMRPWLMTTIAAARSFGVDIIDGVYNDIADAEGFARECAEARDMGFDGKTLIHPNQIEACNKAFTPSAEEIAQAKAIVAAFEAPENKGRGVIALDGRMVERLHADIARRTVAIADAVAARGA